MAFKLVTLNIQSDVHLNKVGDFFRQNQPDAVCLQEVFAADTAVLEEALGYKLHFALETQILDPIPNIERPKGDWGIAFGSRLPLVSISSVQYRELGKNLPVPRKQGAGEEIPIALVARVQDGDQVITMVSTHFTWSPKAVISPLQINDVFNLKQYLDESLTDYILCGDFNAPRGKTLFKILGAGLIDHLPKDITTTLDENLHYAGKLDLVVDTFFSTPEYQFSQVQVIGRVSDHKALMALVEKTNRNI